MNTTEYTYKFIKDNLTHNPIANASIFNTMRILKKVNPGDTYLENYLWHYEKRNGTFVDYYHLLWAIGSALPINKMLEIGCRTGISICQLLSSMQLYAGKEAHLFDIFNDGFISPEIVKVNLRHLNIPTDIAHFHIGDSLKTIPEFKASTKTKFDYVLVDGNHDKQIAAQDLENIIGLVAPQGGLLFFDDIAPDGCNLKDIWDDFKNKHAADFCFCENYDGKGIGIGVHK